MTEMTRGDRAWWKPAREGWRLGRRWLRGLASRHYATAKAVFQLELWLDTLRHGDPLLVYQMGKVGSTSVVRSLKAAGWRQPVFHIHDLSNATLASNERLYQRKFHGEWQRPGHVWTSQFVRWQIARGRRQRPWRIITLTRDPVRRNLSAFFQTLELEFDRDVARNGAPPNAPGLDELGPLFLSREDWHNYPLTWFDAELRGNFGVDVYAHPFPQAVGYQRYQSPSADVLVIKLEMLDQCGPQAFREFLDLDGWRGVRANSASEKRYHAVYQKLLATLRLPEPYLDRMYGSKYVRHFYSEAEIEQFRAGWCGAGLASHA